MKTLKIDISDETARRLDRIAERLDITPEDLVRATVEEKIGEFDSHFEEAADRVLEKNEELYRRLS